MADKPWFKDGLRFKCTQCGDCCTGAPGFVWVNAEEIAALATRLEMTVAEFERKYVRRSASARAWSIFDNGDCVFFDGQKPQMHRLRGPTAAVPHLAVLGFERPHAGSLEGDLRGLPRQRPGASWCTVEQIVLSRP